MRTELAINIKHQLHKIDNGVEIDIRLITDQSVNEDGKKQEVKALSEEDNKRRLEIEETVIRIRQFEVGEIGKLGLSAPSESESDDANST